MSNISTKTQKKVSSNAITVLTDRNRDGMERIVIQCDFACQNAGPLFGNLVGTLAHDAGATCVFMGLGCVSFTVEFSGGQAAVYQLWTSGFGQYDAIYVSGPRVNSNGLFDYEP